MSPAAGGDKRLRSASSIIADTTRGYHILKIDGYSLTKGTPTGECLKSHPFTLGGHRWCIHYYPNGDKPESKDYISIFLHLDQSVSKAVKACYQLNFIDDVDEKTLAFRGVRIFESNGSRGFTQFMKREDFEKSKHLKDDSFAIRCDMVVINEFRVVQEKADLVDTPVFVSVPPSSLHEHLGDLLRTEKGADVVFEVGGETFAAHRCVLAARSPVFSAELLGMMKESDTAGVVRIDDMEAKVFKTLLHFVYTDSLPKTKKEEEEKEKEKEEKEEGEKEEEEDVMFQHLLVAADRYNLERLKLMCEEKLCNYIDSGTVATVLALAEQHHCTGLKKACFSFLRSPENLKAVMSSDGFKHLSRSCPTIMEELVAMLGT
ncbi:hypothetical protein EJB05_22754, partial [Eragrostis curvula]